jgi:hypothetical protein
MSKGQLRGLVLMMLGLIVLAFAFVLGSGINYQKEALSSSTNDMFAEVGLGTTAMRRHSSTRVWVTRLDNTQRKILKEITHHVRDPQGGCSASTPVCVLLAQSVYAGLDLSYTLKAPPQIPESVPWVGGFVDPSSGSVFDLLGRSYSVAKDDGRTSLATLAY